MMKHKTAVQASRDNRFTRLLLVVAVCVFSITILLLVLRVNDLQTRVSNLQTSTDQIAEDSVLTRAEVERLKLCIDEKVDDCPALGE